MDFAWDKDGTLHFEPAKYIEKMMDSYQRMFGKLPRAPVHSPLNPGDHPTLDDSDFLDNNQMSLYQSLIGMLQWIISIGRFDVQVAVMLLSSFQAAPRQGHMQCAQRIFGYIRKFPHAAV